MGFTTPCFIRKNTPELRKKLEELGYTFVPNGYNEWSIPIEKCEYLACGIGRYQGYDISYYTGRLCKPQGVDCGTNESLFLAIAALRDDTDKEQFFVTEVRFGSINDPYTIIEKGAFLKCCMDKWKIPKNKFDSMGIPSHKATVEELIEHFKE